MTDVEPAQGRIAFCVVPHVGGIYRVYQRLRRTLAPRGWDVLGVQVGDETARWTVRPELADEGWQAIAGDERELASAARAFVDWVVDQKIKIVMPMSSPAAVAAVPHLPPDVRVINRCISITPHAYGIATANLDWVDRIVVSSRRQEDDLRKRGAKIASKLIAIPNAVELDCFAASPSPDQVHLNGSAAGRWTAGDAGPADSAGSAGPARDTGDAVAEGSGGGPVRLAYVGRLMDREKGTLLLAEVLGHLRQAGVAYWLGIAGSGKDEPRVRQSLAGEIAAGRVQMLGDRTAGEIAALLSSTDIFLLPSKHEGFPNALLEAMAAGAVPIASRIGGVTDWILRDGETGYLCPINDARAMADRVTELARNPELRQRIAGEARRDVAERFSAEQVARQWEALFQQVAALPRRGVAPRPWNEFTASAAFTRRSRFRWIPASWRHGVRESLERIRSRRSSP